MWLTPEEFYNLDIEDYPLLQRAKNNERQTNEGILRRAALLVGMGGYLGGQGNKARNYQEYFHDSWPYGDKVVHEKIDERITRLRKQAKQDVEYLNKHAAKIQEVVALKRKAQNSHAGRRT